MGRKWTLGIAGIFAAMIVIVCGLGDSWVSRIDADRFIVTAVLVALNGALIWRLERLNHLHQDDYNLFQSRKLFRRKLAPTWKQRLLVGVDWLE